MCLGEGERVHISPAASLTRASSGKRPRCHGSFSHINSLDLIVKNASYI